MSIQWDGPAKVHWDSSPEVAPQQKAASAIQWDAPAPPPPTTPPASHTQVPTARTKAGPNPLDLMANPFAKAAVDELHDGSAAVLTSLETTANNLLHSPGAMFIDAIFGSGQRLSEGALTAPKGTSPLGRIGAGIDLATHPFDVQRQGQAIPDTMHVLGLDKTIKWVDQQIDKAPPTVGMASKYAPRTSETVQEGKDFEKGVNHFTQVFAGLTAIDPYAWVPIMGQAFAAAKTIKLLNSAADGLKDITGSGSALKAVANFHQTLANSPIKSAAKQVFGVRQELDTHLHPHAKGARIGIEAKVGREYTEPAKKEDERLVEAHGSDGEFLKSPLGQHYLRQAYVYGDGRMRQDAIEMGYEPSAAEQKLPPQSFLNFKDNEGKKASIWDDLNEIQSGRGRGVKTTTSFKTDTQSKILGLPKRAPATQSDIKSAMKVRLARNRDDITKGMVNRETKDYLKRYGGWKHDYVEGKDGQTYDKNPIDVSKLSHDDKVLHTGVGRITLDPIKNAPVIKQLRQLGVATIQGNFVPHGKNLTELAYLHYGPEGFGRSIGYAGSGLSEEQLARPAMRTLQPSYIHEIKNPIAKKLIGPGQKVLERIELGVRQAGLDYLDKVWGPTKTDPKFVTPDNPTGLDLQMEYKKADQVRRDIGDYRNASLFVQALQSVGGPFIIFRGQIVPSSVGRSLLKRPQRAEALARAEVSTNEDPDQATPGHTWKRFGGVVDDAGEALDPLTAAGYFTKPSSAGPLGVAEEYISRIMNNQGISGQELVGDQLRNFVPGMGLAQTGLSGYGAIPGAPGAEGAEALGQAPYSLPPGVSPLLAALYQTFGGDVGFVRSPKTQQKAQHYIRRDVYNPR